MAARADAASDRVSLAAGPSITGGLSVCMWVKLAVDRNDFSTFCRIHAGSGGNTAITIGTKSDGVTPFVFSPGNASGVAGSALALDTWTFVGYTVDPGASNATAFYRGTTPGSLVKTTGTVPISQTPTGLTFFGRSASDADEWANLSQAYARIWGGVVMSDAEMEAESASATAVRTSGLFDHWAFAGAALTGVNGNTLSAGSTALTSDTDPVLGGSGNARSADFLALF